MLQVRLARHGVVRGAERRGVAATELALLLPLLVFLFAIGVDWSRVFYYSVTIDNCARNGALYVSDPFAQIGSQYKNVTEAALADAPNISPPPTVTTASGVYKGYNYIDCTVTYPFKTFTHVPGIPATTTLTRTVRVFTFADSPK